MHLSFDTCSRDRAGELRAYDPPVGLQQEARKAESRSVFMGQRVLALCRCVERYSPLGFEATLDYLEQKAGPFRTNEDALLAAVAMLREAHSLWQQELRQHAEQRRSAKRAGQRAPRPADANPNVLRTWHGRERDAALFAVRRWRDRTRDRPVSDERERELRALADLAMASEFSADDLADLESMLRHAATLATWETYQADPQEYFRGRTLSRIANHVQVVVRPQC